MKTTDQPMESDQTFKDGYKVVPSPKVQTRKADSPAQIGQPMPMGAKRVWNNVRPHKAIAPESRAKPEQTVPKHTSVHMGSGPGYNDSTGIKGPDANLDSLTPTRKA